MALASTFIVGDGSWSDYAQKVLWYEASFFAGATVSRHLRTWQRIHPALPAAMLAFTVAWGYVAAHDSELRTALGFSTFLLSLVGVLGVLWLAPRLPRIRFLEWVGRGSIVVYLVNLTTITVAFESIDALGITAPWAVIGLLLIAGLLVPRDGAPAEHDPLPLARRRPRQRSRTVPARSGRPSTRTRAGVISTTGVCS